MKKPFIMFILIQSLWSQNNAYKKFQAYMNISGGRTLSIHFYQEQSGRYFESTGFLYYHDAVDYVFDEQKQRVIYKDGLITTINKTTEQIIYDNNIQNDISVLDILSGKEDRITIEESILEKNGFKIPFLISDWDMKGYLLVSPGSGEPRMVTVESSDDMKIIIKILSSELGQHKQIPSLDTAGYEIIDLRE